MVIIKVGPRYKLNVLRSRLTPPEGGLSIKRFLHRANFFAAILAAAVALITSVTLARVTVQSYGHSTPPMPAQSTVQAPARAHSAAQTQQAPQSVKRTVTVTFDYDFSKLPPCSAKVTKKCIQQFDVWEVSADKPIFLFTIPVPPKARGIVKGITGSAPQKRSFFPGAHRFGVSAKMPAPGGESSPYQCMTFAQVLPDNPAASAPSTQNLPQK